MPASRSGPPVSSAKANSANLIGSCRAGRILVSSARALRMKALDNVGQVFLELGIGHLLQVGEKGGSVGMRAGRLLKCFFLAAMVGQLVGSRQAQLGTLGAQQNPQDRARLIAALAQQALFGFAKQSLPVLAVDPGPTHQQRGVPAKLPRRSFPGSARGAQLGGRLHVATRANRWNFHVNFLCTGERGCLSAPS